MAQQRIVWTVLPHGRVEEGDFKGRLRVSIVGVTAPDPAVGRGTGAVGVPRVARLAVHADQVTFRLRIGAPRRSIWSAWPRWTQALWERLFPGTTPVAGFQFKNMSLVNLRSFAVRNVLGLLRTYYGAARGAVGARHTQRCCHGRTRTRG